MKLPCANCIPFVFYGLYFLKPELSYAQFQNLTLITTALILGAKFNLTEISHMWLKDKAVSTLSHFLSDAKFSTDQMQHLYILQVLHLYKIRKGFFLIDDTMKHHTKFCQWIHGTFVLFDHAVGTNLKATCIVFLYYSDGDAVKFPITFRIFYKEEDKAKWLRLVKTEHKTKYDLALEMLKWSLEQGFPKCIVLADSWFGIDPFIRGLRALKLDYILEIKAKYSIKDPCEKTKLTPKGRVAKHQYDVVKLPKYFKKITSITKCGFAIDFETGKEAKILYHAKITTATLNSTPKKHRIVESIDPQTLTAKYFLTNQLHWEATKILSDYSNRWVIEEFFRNAKQLSDMEGATIRSKRGITLALCIVSWIDFLLHHENYKKRTAGKLTKESLTIPSIVRQAQYDNLQAILDKSQQDKDFIFKWLEVEREKINRKRKKRYQLIEFEKQEEDSLKKAA
ncbi:MAG: transposase [Lentisphaerae bacterium]|nr:transposase [Lentisphaerota bacterium]